jgi:hypothetical protein
MTHPPDVVEAVLRLSQSGRPPSEVARSVGLPRRTVVDWVAGRTPRRDADPRSERLIARLPLSYAYLLGLYLGDGCVSEGPRGVYKLRVALDVAYPGIAAECERAMAEVLPASRVGRRRTPDNCFEIYSYSKRWPALLPQHGPGKKHLRPIVLEDWQRELVARSPDLLLRGLIHSDGCRFINTGRNWTNPRYAFSNRSADIRAIFCDACDLVGLRWTTAPHTIYVSRKADVAVLDDLVGPKA